MKVLIQDGIKIIKMLKNKIKKFFAGFIVCLALLSFGFFVYAADNCPKETPACQKIVDFPSAWKQKLTLGAVIGGAVIDAINPCEFAILILLMGTLLLNGEKKKALYSGISFCLAVFLAYFGMGLGLLKIIQNLHISLIVIKIVGILSIILGLLHIKDYIKYEAGGFVMEVPKSWRPLMKNLVRNITNPIGAFFAGLLISIFLLPCTSGPYMVILTLLGNQAPNQIHALFYLLLYNIIFIMPMAIIVWLMYFGLKATEAEDWRKNKIRLLHLIAGALLIILGIAILMRLI